MRADNVRTGIRQADAASAIRLTLRDLATVVHGDIVAASDIDADVDLGPRRVAIHSSLVERGTIFFALHGKRDGHQWVLDALDRGASCAIVEQTWSGNADGRALVRVDNSLTALQDLARWYRLQLRCEVIAVAGSVGKTSTKDALVSFLGESGFCYGSPGSFNSQIGVPLSLLSCPPEADYAVIEIAATEMGEMARHADMVRPTSLVVTNVGSRFQHRFGSMERYAAELSELARHLPPNGKVVCGDPATNLARFLPTGTSLEQPRTARWPVERIERIGSDIMSVLVRSPDATTSRIEVATSSSWLADDVALAAAAATILAHAPRSQSYSPTSLDLQTWKSPKGVHFLRCAVVDDAMAWRVAIADAVATAGGNGRIYLVLNEAVHALSENTLLTLRDLVAQQTASIYMTAGRAADIMADSKSAAELHVFHDAGALGAALIGEVRAGDVVALFTGRGQMIDGIAKELFEAMAPTRLYIDVGAIEINLAMVRHRCPGAQIMAVVKASAYGADATELARHLAAAGVDQFAVSHTDEGVALRRSGVSRPILVLLATPDELDKARIAHLTPCVHSEELLRAVLASPDRVANVHLEVDTGMHRTGLAPDITPSALLALQRANVPVAGIMTHLASADEQSMDDFTRGQLALFDQTISAAEAAGATIPPRHALASAGIIRFPGHAMEMVRVGLALLGIAPSLDCRAVPLVPSLTLVSRLIDRRVLRPGDRVGYGGTFQADRELTVGVVQLGYYDGVFRSFAAHGSVVINGRRCAVVGRISMDSMVIDLSECPEAEVGYDVLVFGARGRSSQSIEHVAEAMQTIPYEVISRLGPRVQRIFVRH
ncbi:MAG: alanine racemase [Gemmatimonadota bacterium]